jgi:hypothetical protein
MLDRPRDLERPGIEPDQRCVATEVPEATDGEDRRAVRREADESLRRTQVTLGGPRATHLVQLDRVRLGAARHQASTS